ncbi:hypothetical protein C0J52_02214 [Blattella germanica]|nr:hypothetical protein C0J52_02214 [Blattella germanica]
MASVSGELTLTKRKKGVKSVIYHREIIKESRLKNQAYVNYKGETVKPREQGYDCRCKWKCITTKISSDVMMELYSKFLTFGTKNEQDGHLQSLIERKPKDHTYKYWLSSSGGHVQVCKLAFLSVYGISDDILRRIRDLLSSGKSPKDMRGKQRSANAMPAEVTLLIEDHINSFPINEGHYTSREYKYLSPNLNVKKMWKLFQSEHPQRKVSYWYYWKIFKDNFNLKFNQPQVDTCCLCEQLKVKIKSSSLNDNAKRVAVAEHIVHRRKADKFYKKIHHVKNMCRERDDVAGISIDFMQNLMHPVIPIQDTFYLRQLTYNIFNIHDLKSEKAVFYTYDETTAKKSPNEVCSFILSYINEYVSSSIRQFFLFSDGCAGQNKNHCLIRLMLALEAKGRFDSIHQYFPIRGHSYLPCDRDFSVVKRTVKKQDRVYLPLDYTELITSSSSKNAFTVHMVHKEEILDFKSWWPAHYKKNVLSVESQGRTVPREMKQHFSISEFMEFSYYKQTPGVVKTRNFIDGMQEHTFRLAEQNLIPDFPSKAAFSSEVAMISDKKMADLKKFKPYLPHDQEIQSFYGHLYSKPTYKSQER